jgi:type I restriction enzyme, R subunit
LLSKEKVRQKYETAESASGKDRERKPGLASGILNAIMDAFAAHSTMSEQALDSERVRSGLKDGLMEPAQLY